MMTHESGEEENSLDDVLLDGDDTSTDDDELLSGIEGIGAPRNENFFNDGDYNEDDEDDDEEDDSVTFDSFDDTDLL